MGNKEAEEKAPLDFSTELAAGQGSLDTLFAFDLWSA
jgi:hypothetical protein